MTPSIRKIFTLEKMTDQNAIADHHQRGQASTRSPAERPRWSQRPRSEAWPRSYPSGSIGNASAICADPLTVLVLAKENIPIKVARFDSE
jgi:hypothetical protein